MDKTKPIIVFATGYVQWLTFCKWKDIPQDMCHRIVNNEKYVVDTLIRRKIAPVPEGNVFVLPNAKYNKTLIKKLTDQATI